MDATGACTWREDQAAFDSNCGPAATIDSLSLIGINGRRFKLTTIEPHRTVSWLIAHS